VVVKLAVKDEVKSNFRPGFVNRIDEIVIFHTLDEANIASIARVQLRELERRVLAMEMDIEISDAAVAELAKAGFDPGYGARPRSARSSSRSRTRSRRRSWRASSGPRTLFGWMRRAGGDLVSQQLCRSEPDGPLPQERDVGGWASADRGIRRRRAQRRQSAQGRQAGLEPCTTRVNKAMPPESRKAAMSCRQALCSPQRLQPS
jgi:hypothetical protein